jgi:hypothetical protein
MAGEGEGDDVGEVAGDEEGEPGDEVGSAHEDTITEGTWESVEPTSQKRDVGHPVCADQREGDATRPLHRLAPVRQDMFLDGLHGEGEEVLDEGDFFLDEGFGVADAGEEAVVAGGGEGAFADVFFGDEEA